MADLEQLFRDNCGDAELIQIKRAVRDGHEVVVVAFRIMPENRMFTLDGVVHGPGERELSSAVWRLADIAANVRRHIEPEAS